MPIAVYAGLVFAGLVGYAIGSYFNSRQPEDQPEDHGAERTRVESWSSRRKLDFFCNASNLLMQLPTYQAIQIEINSYNVLVRGNWRKHLTPRIKNYLFPKTREPGYDKTSVKSLLQAIRNNGIRQNYNQLQQAIKKEFVSYPDGYLVYWTDKFPDLLMHVYDEMQVYRSDPCMLKFYR